MLETSVVVDFRFYFLQQFGDLQLLRTFLEAGFAFDAGIHASIIRNAVVTILELPLVIVEFELVIDSEDGGDFNAGGAGHAVAAARAGDGARFAVGLDGFVENLSFIVGERLEFGERLDVLFEMLHAVHTA